MPAGAREEVLFPEARQWRLRGRREGGPDQGEGWRRGGLPLHRGCRSRRPRSSRSRCGRSTRGALAGGSAREPRRAGGATSSTQRRRGAAEGLRAGAAEGPGGAGGAPDEEDEVAVLDVAVELAARELVRLVVHPVAQPHARQRLDPVDPV